jgi:hypothetical protein
MARRFEDEPRPIQPAGVAPGLLQRTVRPPQAVFRGFCSCSPFSPYHPFSRQQVDILHESRRSNRVAQPGHYEVLEATKRARTAHNHLTYANGVGREMGLEKKVEDPAERRP